MGARTFSLPGPRYEFPEKYQQGVGIFLIALSVSLLTVALTVGYKLYQATRINPSIVLKHE
jgi:hypothetical protein